MITASLTYTATSAPSTVIDNLRRWNVSDDVTFHEVTAGGFKGGFFLNRKLPYTPVDRWFKNEQKEITVLLSGNIYNKSELLNHTNIDSDIPDPELIAELFYKEGPEFVKRLNGDFVIFILLNSKREAFLFRDHAGISPMTYAIEDNTLYFSSDIIGLARAFSDGRKVVSDYLLSYFRFINYRKTPVEKVKKLLPGHWLHFTEEGSEITKYWAPEKITTDSKLTHEQMLSDLRAIVWDAVKIRCDHRFTAAAHVSSGIDSGLVSTLARMEYPGQEVFCGFSWSPADYTPEKARYDERDIVIKSCEKTGIRPLFSDMKVADFKRNVSAFYDNQGYFYEERIADMAVRENVNLIFSGWGGDEFISTGDSGIETDLLLGLKWRTFFRRNPVRHPRQFARWMLGYVIYPALGILDRGTAKSFGDDARYIKESFKKSDRRALRDFYFYISRHQHHLRLLHFYNLQERCESWHVMGFRKGAEYRYPLLDRRIIEYMLKVPSVLLCTTDYYRPVLREISEGFLPDEVRLQWQKSDPVCWEYIGKLFRESSAEFMEEVNVWQTNPDLHFIDFGLLTKDIDRYKTDPGSVDAKVLCRAIVYIKSIHDFTIRFHDNAKGSSK